MARLIDADALKELIRQEPTDGMYTEEILSAIDEQPTVEVPGWIPVTERLPDKELDDYRKQRAGDCDIEVLVMIQGATESTALYYNGDGAFYDDCMNSYAVTHWMLKPEPPEGR